MKRFRPPSSRCSQRSSPSLPLFLAWRGAAAVLYPQTAMASDRATLKVAERSEFGSRPSRRLRRAGLVPGIVYGGGSETRHFQVPEGEARAVLTRGGALIDVQFDGSQATPVVVKEQQRDPVRGSLVHLDLLEVKLDEEIQAEVTIELLGGDDAPGVKEGGVLEHVTHAITIEALPTNIPESIPVDVSGMEIGDTLQLSAVPAPQGVEFALGEGVDADEVTIATLSPPRVEEEPEPEVEEEAELVGEEGEVPEGEEAPAEGEEAPAEGEAAEGGESGESREGE
jgi:large subunit ribosomal protein L25